MPHVVNGIGTWYYGRSRIHRIKAGCEFCNRIGDLTSYDTTLYFVVFFIPVIPLSKKRVIDECPSCRRHRVVAWKEWERQKEQGIGSVLEQLANRPDDHEALGNALGIVTMYQDVELFERIAALAKNDTEIPKLQLQLAQAYSYFGRREEAEAAYQHALRNDDSPEVRKAAALNALRMGEPERADALLAYVTKDRVAEDISYVMLVIDAYQNFGRHEEALALIDKRDDAFPELKADKNLIKQRKQSEKYLGSGKRLNTANLVDSGRAVTSAGSSTLMAKLIFPLILLIAFCAYVGSSFWIGSNQIVYLVNGTNKPYHVTVNGQDVNLPALKETKLRVPEGMVDVKPVDAPYEPVQAEVTTNFWSRPFTRPVFVVNPDRVAVLVEEETTYSKNPGMNPPPVFSMGDPFYRFPSTNLEFEEFPATVTVKGNATITKHRVGIERPISSIATVSYAMTPGRKGANAEEVLKRLCVSSPDEVLFISVFLAQKTPQESIEFLKTGLTAKPLRVEWHRIYQSLIEQTDPKRDLAPEYRALIGDGNNGDAKYLLARVLPDGDESERLLRESIETNPPSIYGFYALGFRALARADFPQALTYARKAAEAKPGQFQFQKLLLDTLWAKGDYADYVEANRVRNPLSASGGSIMEEFRAAVASKNAEQMNSLRARKSMSVGQPNAIVYTDNDFDLAEAVIKGDVRKYLAAAAKEGKANPNGGNISDNAFYAALLGKRMDDAERLISTDDDPSFVRNTPVEPGLLALAFYKSGQIPKAEKYAHLYAKSIGKLSQTERKIAYMIEGSEKFDLTFALNSSLQADQKRIALAILAYQNPDQEAPLRKLAKQLDFQKDVVSLTLAQFRE